MKKVPNPGMGWDGWGEGLMSFFTPEGGLPGVSPTKRLGQSMVLKPLLEFWVF